MNYNEKKLMWCKDSTSWTLSRISGDYSYQDLKTATILRVVDCTLLRSRELEFKCSRGILMDLSACYSVMLSWTMYILMLYGAFQQNIYSAYVKEYTK